MESSMAVQMTTTMPKRAGPHERLQAFIGKWHADGSSYAVGQTKQNPRSTTEKWLSDETFEWLPGQFFVLQRWDAMTGSNPFQGTAIISWDDTNKNFVTRSYENHGFVRDYLTSVDGETWTLTGDTERASVEFTDGGNTQKIAWEWRQTGDSWLALCERTAKRVG